MNRFALALIALLFTSPALASQGSGCMPTTGLVSGLQLSTNINAAVAALISSNSGTTAPATSCTGVPIAGQIWLDTSGSTTNDLKIFDSAAWQKIGTLDLSAHIWNPVVGGGTGTVAGAGTTDLCAVPTAAVTVSGASTITSFGGNCVAGQLKFITFSGASTVVYNATSMILPGRANISTAADDTWTVQYVGSGTWRALSVQQVSGAALASVPVGTVLDFSGLTTPAGFLLLGGQAVSRSTYAGLMAVYSISQSATRTSGSAVVTMGSTAGLKPGFYVSSTGVNCGQQISTVDSGTQITMNGTATASGTTTALFFPHGGGDCSTTFNLPDMRGRAAFGRDDMNGSAAGRINVGGSGINGTSIGAPGGNQAINIATSQLPAHSHGVFLNDPGHTHFGTFTVDATLSSAVGGTAFVMGNYGARIGSPNVQTNFTNAALNTTGLTISSVAGGGTANSTANAGGGGATNIQNGTLILDKIVKY